MRKLEFLALHDFCVINIEKVRVEQGLDDSGEEGDEIELNSEGPLVKPIEDVEEPVDSQREDVVHCETLSLTSSLDHEKLRKNRHGFKPN